MRLLFEIDRHDYADCTHVFTRPSARGIVLRDGLVAMIYSTKYGYYKFPGGGIEPGEDPVTAMIRETREEAGLVVIPDTVRPFGRVHRVQRSTSDPTEKFVQDNYYYLCEAEDTIHPQHLDAYEAEEGHTLVFISPAEAIRQNRQRRDSPYDAVMFEREARVMEMLLQEGLAN